MPILAQASYRDRQIFQALHNYPGNSEQSRNFERLFKLLYKLGKHVAQCKRLVLATTRLHSELARGFRIETIDGSPEQKIPLVVRSCGVQNISHRIFSETAKEQMFLQQLREIYSEEELNRVLAKDLCKTKTRVHAELLVLDHFEQSQGRFLFEQDRYIGCSKPACYLCHLFISNHPGRYSHPASHQKLYPAWRLPDIPVNGPNAALRFQNQKTVLELMTRAVRHSLDNDVSTSAGRRMHHPDSTAGGISTLIDIGSDFITLPANVPFDELLEMLNLQSSPMNVNSDSMSVSLPSSGNCAEVESDGDFEIGGVKL
ncbi:uncharacterized protein N7483_008017 [Penicillium malachiteum]|uniref:uncharacterized protein n=1 Tax=Penicillium malachiteum TaxID=1324776 RepID=UPI002546ACEE|nr:uncharacterized protein N7483_008017 [Penicillium malachiteum]KAJ5726660.1 hypothetical protein N7483_008017 [Penicillium malachiteum]